MTLRVGSLFSGIGGLELGLERAGMQTVFQVECDPYALQVLHEQWPDVPRYFDVRQVHRGPGHCRIGPCPGCLPLCDVLVGGFPCQDVSLAGNRTERAGLAGERSGLWGEFARLVCELRPCYVLVENVAALLADGMGAVLGDLAACGYDAEWDCLPASAFGAPHRRDRLFVVAYPHGAGRGGQSEQDGEALQPRVLPPRWDHAHGLGMAARRAAEAAAGLRGMADAPASRLDTPRLRALGNAVVPAVAEAIGRRIVAHAHASTCREVNTAHMGQE